MSENEKTRKVNVIMYHDDQIEEWRVAVHLPDNSVFYTMQPSDGFLLAMYLQGESGTVTPRVTYVYRALQDLVAADLLTEVGRQLESISNLARYSQEMADGSTQRLQAQAQTKGNYLQ